MEIEKNLFKKRLKDGVQQIGLWSSICSKVGGEIIADAGFDWILLDTEHSPVEISEIYGLLQSVARGTAVPVVRIAWNDTILFKRALDIGVQSILVPFVQNAEEAKAAVAASRYPPKGIRGVAGSTRATRYGRIKEYIHEIENQLCIIVQIETSSALENLEDIASVEGIDAVFIGPSDLAASMGNIGNPEHPDVQANIRSALMRLNSIEIPCGILATNKEIAERYLNMGFAFVAGGVDTALLAKATDDLAISMRKVLSDS